MNAFDQLLAALALTSLLAIVLWAARTGRISVRGWLKLRNATPNDLIILSRRALTPHHAIHLVSIAGEIHLVGTFPQGMQLLSLSKAQSGAAVASDKSE